MSFTPPLPQPDDDAPPSRSGLDLGRLVRSDEDAASTVAQSVRHSSRVRRLKLILPLAAVALVVIMLAWSDMDKNIEPVRREAVAPQMVGKNELIKPKFQSEDTSQQPYTITADRAFQESGNLDRVIMEKPVADIALKGGSWIALKAKDGEYIQSEQKLKLNGDVKFFHDDGYELTTDHVDLDVQGQTAVTDSPVSGQGPAGTISGQGLKADGKTGTLIFTGPATLTIRKSKPLQPAPETAP